MNGRVSVMSRSRRVVWLELRPTEDRFNASTSSTVLARLNYQNLSFLFLLVKNTCIFLGVFFLFSFYFFFFTVCASAWFTGVDQSHVIQLLRPAGVWRKKAVLAVCLAAKTGCQPAEEHPAGCWYSSARGLCPGGCTLLAGRVLFWLLVRQLSLSLPFSPSVTHTLKVPFFVVFLSVMSSPVWKYIW